MGYDTPWWITVLLAAGTIFSGLSLLTLLSVRTRLPVPKHSQDGLFPVPAAVAREMASAAVETALAADESAWPDRKKVLAAVSAALAEAEGTDVPGFRIVSFKRRGQA